MTDSLEFGRLHWPVLSWNVLSSLTYVFKWALKCEWPSVREVREILITKMKPQKSLVLSSSTEIQREKRAFFTLQIFIVDGWLYLSHCLDSLPYILINMFTQFFANIEHSIFASFVKKKKKKSSTRYFSLSKAVVFWGDVVHFLMKSWPLLYKAFI